MLKIIQKVYILIVLCTFVFMSMIVRDVYASHPPGCGWQGYICWCLEYNLITGNCIEDDCESCSNYNHSVSPPNIPNRGDSQLENTCSYATCSPPATPTCPTGQVYCGANPGCGCMPNTQTCNYWNANNCGGTPPPNPPHCPIGYVQCPGGCGCQLNCGGCPPGCTTPDGGVAKLRTDCSAIDGWAGIQDRNINLEISEMIYFPVGQLPPSMNPTPPGWTCPAGGAYGWCRRMFSNGYPSENNIRTYPGTNYCSVLGTTSTHPNGSAVSGYADFQSACTSCAGNPAQTICNRGFSWTVPNELKDGQSHNIVIKTSNGLSCPSTVIFDQNIVCNPNFCPSSPQLACDMSEAHKSTISWQTNPAVANPALQNFAIRMNHDPGNMAQCRRTSDNANVDWLCSKDFMAAGTVSCNNGATCDDRYIAFVSLGNGQHQYHNGTTLVTGDFYDEITQKFTIYVRNMQPSNGASQTYSVSIQAMKPFGTGVWEPLHTNTCDGSGLQAGIQAGNVSCACTYSAPTPAPSVGPSAIPNQATGISATTPNGGIGTVLNWTQPTDWGDTSGPSCVQVRGYDIYITPKANNDISVTNTTNCNFTTPIITGHPSTTLSIAQLQARNFNLEWGRAYCWRVVARNASLNPAHWATSPTYTFRTNQRPDFSRAGIKFENAPQNDYGAIGSGTTPNPGTPYCTYQNTTTCTTQVNPANTSNLGGSTCWLATGDTNNSKDDLVYLWFEYTDPDTTLPSESFRHTLTFVEQGSTPLSVDQTNMGTNPEIKLRYSVQNAAPGTIAKHSGIPASTLDIDTASSTYTKTGNTIRIVYRLRFTSTSLIQKRFNIHAVMEHGVRESQNPGVLNGEIMTDTMSYTSSPDLDIATKSYRSFGSINIDNNPPVATYEPNTIVSVNSFDLPWRFNESAGGSGIADIITQCSSTATSFPMIFQKYSYQNAQNTTQTQNVNQTITIPTTPVECLTAAAKTALLSNSNLTTTHILPDYRNYSNLDINIASIVDRACNQGTPYLRSPKVADEWVSTYQGSVYSEADISYRGPDSADGSNSINTQNNIYLMDQTTPIYLQTGDEMMDLSKGFLGARNQIFGTNSTLNAEIQEYNDINKQPRFGGVSDKSSWYNYVHELIQQKGKNITLYTPSSGIISNFDSVCPGAECIVEINSITSEVVLDNFVCNKKMVILMDNVAGNRTLRIRGNITNQNENTACLIVTKADVVFSTQSQYDVSSNFTTSPYNIVEAFVIADSDVTLEQNIVSPPGNIQYADGLYINGGLVTSGDLIHNKTLGLRNNTQPPLVIMHDTRYMYTFGDLFNIRSFRIVEK